MSVYEEDGKDTTLYKVVINGEEQYSIWPMTRDNPNGWTSVGITGSKADCLAHIESAWTDMRPLSVRVAMAQDKAESTSQDPPPKARLVEDSLPVRLSRGPQPVELVLRPERTLDALLRQVETGYLHVRFTGTRGGTELSFGLEAADVERIKSHVASGEGPMPVSGALTFDYVPVRCVVEIELPSLTGIGQLQIVAPKPAAPSAAKDR